MNRVIPILWNLQTNVDIDESNVKYGNVTDGELKGSNYPKQNEKCVTKGSQKRIQHCIQLRWIMLDEMCFPSNILSNIPSNNVVLMITIAEKHHTCIEYILLFDFFILR